jgi:hypothetical protein
MRMSYRTGLTETEKKTFIIFARLLCYDPLACINYCPILLYTPFEIKPAKMQEL